MGRNSLLQAAWRSTQARHLGVRMMCGHSATSDGFSSSQGPSAGSAASSTHLSGHPSTRPTLKMLPRASPERGGDARVARLVPWIFRNETANFQDLRALGEPALLVNVESSEGRELGSAVCNLQTGGPQGINVLARMMSNNAYLPIDHGFFAARIRRALQHREHFLGSQPFYRLINAEGDELPGIVCDRYNDVLCLQFTAFASELLFEDLLLDVLEATLAPRAIIVRADADADRSLEKAKARSPAVARGKYDGPTVFPAEDGFAFEANLLEKDWKSGRFFAERLQRSLLTSLMSGTHADAKKTAAPQPLRVLSLFGESLGLKCSALGAHLTYVEGLGESRQHHAEAVARRNGCSDRLECIRLESPQPAALGQDRLGAFDIVTLEPPALAPTYGRLEEGMRQYTAWVSLAAAAVRPQGLLLFACRSRTMSAVRLLRCVNLGIWSARRQAKLVHRSASAPADFPVHLALPSMSEMQVVGLRVQ